MNIIDELNIIYSDLNSNYSAKETQARARRHFRKERIFQQQRALNDQAYFLFMFTRLEERISFLATSLINSKVTSISNYKNKRVWQLIKERNDSDRLPLKEKVSLLTQFNGADYQLILRYKRQRDTIAHGGVVLAMNVATIFTDIGRLYNVLSI